MRFKDDENMKVAIIVLIVFIVSAFAFMFLHFKYGEKFILKPMNPTKKPEVPPEIFLPQKLPWLMRKSTSKSDMFYSSFLPKRPEVIFSSNVSTNVDGMLTNAIVDTDRIFLADSQGIYALDRINGELVWGVEVYSDSLEGRVTSSLQPVTKWKALGLWRFIKAYGVGNFLYVATSSSLDLDDAFLLALSKESGSVEWMVKLESEGNTSSRSSITSNLVVADGKIYIGSVRDEGYVFCVGENGVLLWRSKVWGNVRGLAYGDGILFVTTEPSNKLYALDPKTGEILWSFEHNAMLTSPSYHNGKVILTDSYGDLLAISNEGKMLWRKSLGIGADVNNDPYFALDAKNIYVVRSIGEKPLDLLIVDFDGNVIGNFTLESGEYGGKPIASQDVIILPVKSSMGGKIYLLWRGWAKINEFSFQNDDWIPMASAAYGEIYVVTSPGKFFKLADKRKPVINSVSTNLFNDSLIINITAYDSESALYKVLLVYSVNDSTWNYVDMEISRKYVVEPIGGYGLDKEIYTARIPLQPDITLEFYVVAIDNSGNYEISTVYAYQISKG